MGFLPSNILHYDADKDSGREGLFGVAKRKLGLARALAPQSPRDPALEGHLRELMALYRTDSLVGIAPERFEARVRGEIGKVDYEVEGYAPEDVERQRDLSIRFTWGHNHDFGRFQLEGRMGDRHITLMRNFLTLFGVPRDHFAGKTVLDVGCWTGGTMLILAGLGARVTSIEEVRKYARMAAFLAESFGVDARVEGKSVYGIDDREAYDVAYFPGVIYHLSDPVLALRLLCNALRTGGEIYVESAGTNVRGSVCRYDGCVLHHRRPEQSPAALNRGGWNWFIPSPLALARMLWAAGFDGVRVAWADGRLYAHAKKTRRVGITRAGLSRTDVP